MEFRGIVCAPISLTRAVPWNSMEIGVRNSMKPLLSSKIDILMLRGFYWSAPISLNLGCANVASMEFHQIQCPNFDVTTSSMEFHGSPWNLVCANFADTCSSMEYHGTWECANFDDQSSSMEIHEHSLVIKIGNFDVALILLDLKHV